MITKLFILILMNSGDIGANRFVNPFLVRGTNSIQKDSNINSLRTNNPMDCKSMEGSPPLLEEAESSLAESNPNELKSELTKAGLQKILNVDSSDFLSVLTQYENYPGFINGLQSVEIESCTEKSKRITFRANVFSKNLEYTLDYRENLKKGWIEWNLVKSNFFSKYSGHWDVKPIGANQSKITYSLDLGFKIYVPDFILSRLQKNSLPEMMTSFEKEVKRQFKTSDD